MPDTTSAAQTALPVVTVIMPVRNEAAFIERTLQAVLDQDYPPERLELIIADGQSSDDTRARMAAVVARHPHVTALRVQVLDNPGRIVPTGLNRAIRAASGEIIVRIDGHTIVAPDYVRACVEALQRTGAANVGGSMHAVGEGYVAGAIALATSTPLGIGNSSFHYATDERWVETVYLGAFPRRVLLSAGLYDEQFVRHQDYELNHRIRRAGGRILLTGSIRSRYYVRSSLPRLVRQYFQYGIWKGKLVRRSPDAMRWRHAVPPALVVVLLGTLALAPWSYPARWVAGLALASYGVFILGAGAWVAVRRGPRYLPMLPLVFACLHLPWGAGVLCGLLGRRVGPPPASIPLDT